MDTEQFDDPDHVWACPRCGAMLSVFTLETGAAYLGCDQVGCLYASHLEGDDIPTDGGDLLDNL
ncbi:hypothetical protein [Microbacterium sp. A84]|uniref:hypothetical protein n=1 Tax=Microbacterium sp. A84 TaxID=3450715 RepID=UPI003F421A00